MKKLIILLFTVVLSVGSLSAQSTDVKKLIQLANQGLVAAQYNLGVVYRNGRGVPQDDAHAMNLFLL
jgi:TPR repeat protein